MCSSPHYIPLSGRWQYVTEPVFIEEILLKYLSGLIKYLKNIQIFFHFKQMFCSVSDFNVFWDFHSAYTNLSTSLHPHCLFFFHLFFIFVGCCLSLSSSLPPTRSLLCKHLYSTLPSTLCPLLPFQKRQIYAHGIHSTTMTDMNAGMHVNTNKAHNTNSHTNGLTVHSPAWEWCVVVEMGASCSPEAELGHEYMERVSVAVFGAGVRRMKASGCGVPQFRVTNFTNCAFISTQEWFPLEEIVFCLWRPYWRSSAHTGCIHQSILWQCLRSWQNIPLWKSR